MHKHGPYTPLTNSQRYRKGIKHGLLIGALLAAAVIIGAGSVWYSISRPVDYHQATATLEPLPYEPVKIQHVPMPPCDTRGKDCTVFHDAVYTVPEPSTTGLMGLAALAAAAVARWKDLKAGWQQFWKLVERRGDEE